MGIANRTQWQMGTTLRNKGSNIYGERRFTWTTTRTKLLVVFTLLLLSEST